ncbi:hypothetical protein L1049_016428 [Liquidambar formosana]|uniref:Uncharacterized protein n=1 Tax=Liquidambar formosana TaxID=63359 RepID=A0AAP0S1C6_LIQFO
MIKCGPSETDRRIKGALCNGMLYHVHRFDGFIKGWQWCINRGLRRGIGFWDWGFGEAVVKRSGRQTAGDCFARGDRVGSPVELLIFELGGISARGGESVDSSSGNLPFVLLLRHRLK